MVDNIKEQKLKADLFAGVSREDFDAIAAECYYNLRLDVPQVFSALRVIRDLVRSGMCTGLVMHDLTRPKVDGFYARNQRDPATDEIAADIMRDILDNYMCLSGELSGFIDISNPRLFLEGLVTCAIEGIILKKFLPLDEKNILPPKDPTNGG